MYRRGGWVLFTRPALIVLGVLAAAGVGVFAYLVAGRYGTPFVVAKKIGLGGLVFLLGRFAVVVRARARARAGDGVVRAAGRPGRA